MSENYKYKVGDIVESLAGRDAKRQFAVIGLDSEDENYLILADGRLRRADKPKRKKIKHVKLVKESGFEIKDGEKLTNNMLRKNIENAVGSDSKSESKDAKIYKKSQKN